MRSVYHQVLLAPESHHITTFITHEGLFQYKRLPFGLASAPSAFRKIMDIVLTGLKGRHTTLTISQLLSDVISGDMGIASPDHRHECFTCNCFIHSFLLNLINGTTSVVIQLSRHPPIAPLSFKSAVWEYFRFNVQYDDMGRKTVNKQFTFCKHCFTTVLPSLGDPPTC